MVNIGFTFGVIFTYYQEDSFSQLFYLIGINRLIIYTSSEYLLKFVDEWAVPWLERKWFNVRNVNFWRDLLAHLEGIDVKWVILLNSFQII